ncbi:hypothetical protein [Hoeflea sp.]|uniref:hypothetical protein n=1 Tax=Hoeflea sp. TaxID=1940281 RepID=UPI003BAE5174
MWAGATCLTNKLQPTEAFFSFMLNIESDKFHKKVGKRSDLYLTIVLLMSIFIFMAAESLNKIEFLIELKYFIFRMSSVQEDNYYYLEEIRDNLGNRYIFLYLFLFLFLIIHALLIALYCLFQYRPSAAKPVNRNKLLLLFCGIVLIPFTITMTEFRPEIIEYPGGSVFFKSELVLLFTVFNFIIFMRLASEIVIFVYEAIYSSIVSLIK